MRRRARDVVACAALATASAAACGLDFVDRWDGPPVVAREVTAPPDTVFADIVRGISALDLVVARFLPADRAVELAWIAPPGDGRRYLRCPGERLVGTASIQPRVTVQATASGSRVVVASRVRATTTSHCVSTGAFESALLRSLETRIAGTGRGAAPRAEPD